MNHGFPVRLVIPGVYGYNSATKWLTELELTTFGAYDAYWASRGYAQQGPLKTLTRIDTPRGLANIPAGRTAIGGVAWAIHRGIDSVEVKVDDGPWMPARLGDVAQRRHLAPVGDRLGRHPRQPHASTARSTDGDRRAADRGAGRAAPRRRLGLALRRGARVMTATITAPSRQARPSTARPRYSPGHASRSIGCTRTAGHPHRPPWRTGRTWNPS